MLLLAAMLAVAISLLLNGFCKEVFKELPLEFSVEAVKLLDARGNSDFEYEGEMPPDVALNPAMQKVYPFSRLTGPANVLVMPGLQTANIAAKLLKELGGDAVIGPMLVGMQKQVQIAPMTANASDLVTLAVLAAGGIVR